MRALLRLPGAALWQAHAGELWHRFALELRRELARRIGLSRTELNGIVRLSYVKVAEYQRRGLIHFHAVIRLDGPDGPGPPPPGWASTIPSATRNLYCSAAAVNSKSKLLVLTAGHCCTRGKGRQVGTEVDLHAALPHQQPSPSVRGRGRYTG
ncbi:replication initiator [Wenjunlia tyrosinilytica]|uniref:replication initiator n=1 Tax=Wenjunlia tyrosinilytica TaxID=1544741 RepID=UPI003570C7AD